MCRFFPLLFINLLLVSLSIIYIMFAPFVYGIVTSTTIRPSSNSSEEERNIYDLTFLIFEKIKSEIMKYFVISKQPSVTLFNFVLFENPFHRTSNFNFASHISSNNFIIIFYFQKCPLKFKILESDQINFCCRILNSLQWCICPQFENYPYSFHNFIFFLSRKKGKKICPLGGHILIARFARSSQVWARLGLAIWSSRFMLRSFWTSRFALGLVL